MPTKIVLNRRYRLPESSVTISYEDINVTKVVTISKIKSIPNISRWKICIPH